MSDEQAGAELLDGDKIDATQYPPEEPLGLNDLEDKDVPIIGDYAPDSLEERLVREEPDFGEPGAHTGPDERVPPLMEPDDPFGLDVTSEAIAEGGEDRGQLDGPYLTESEDATSTEDNMPAEEAAMHVVDVE